MTAIRARRWATPGRTPGAAIYPLGRAFVPRKLAPAAEMNADPLLVSTFQTQLTALEMPI
jgi:hypothetical protein